MECEGVPFVVCRMHKFGGLCVLRTLTIKNVVKSWDAPTQYRYYLHKYYWPSFFYQPKKAHHL